MMTAILGLIVAALSMTALRHWRERLRRERRLQSRLIRALHVEFGRGGGQLFRSRGPRRDTAPRQPVFGRA